MDSIYYDALIVMIGSYLGNFLYDMAADDEEVGVGLDVLLFLCLIFIVFCELFKS